MYQGSKPPTGYKGDRGEKAKPRKKKRFVVRPTRAMVRYLRNQRISEAFLDICRMNMKPEQFEKVLTAAKRRADKVPSEHQDTRYDNLSYMIVNELKRRAPKEPQAK